MEPHIGYGDDVRAEVCRYGLSALVQLHSVRHYWGSSKCCIPTTAKMEMEMLIKRL